MRNYTVNVEKNDLTILQVSINVLNGALSYVPMKIMLSDTDVEKGCLVMTADIQKGCVVSYTAIDITQSDLFDIYTEAMTLNANGTRKQKSELDAVFTFKNVKEMTFEEILPYIKKGVRVARKGWNGKGMSVSYQKGYPEGVACSQQTADAWDMKAGDLFKLKPYLQIKNVDGTFSMWVPSIGDILAEDWVIVG